MRIGWIGTGVMGKSCCERLLQAGFSLTVFNRTKMRTASLLEHGAIWGDSPRQVAENADVVFTMVGYPRDVEQVVLEPENGVLAGMRSGGILVDMTTSRPSLAVKIAQEAQLHGVYALDAPVSGGDVGARQGTLSVMVGGDETCVEWLRPCWNVLAKTVVYQGPAGFGQHTKMVNQILIAASMLGMCEALIYAQTHGLQLERVLMSVADGAAGSWSVSNLAPRILANNFEPGFRIEHFVKDLGIALEEAHHSQLSLPTLELAFRLYRELMNEGCGHLGTQALIKKYG